MTEETQERTFSVPSPARLELNNIHGSVDIQSGDEGIIRVTAVKHLDSGDPQRTQIEMDQAKDGSLKVQTHYPENAGWLFNNSRPCKVDYSVRIPSSCSLIVSVVTCSVHISGVSEHISVKTVSGPMDLSDIDGNLKVRTVSGKIKAETLSGSLQVDTVSGTIQILKSNLERVTTSTISGNLLLETNLDSGPYQIKSLSGNAILKFPQNASCTIHSSSISSKVINSPQSNRGYGRRGRKIIKNGGGTMIHHRSISGNLHVDSGQASSEESNIPDEVSIRTSPSNRQEILDRIEAGKLSTEDALQMLAKLK